MTPLDLPTPVEPRMAKCFEIRPSTSMTRGDRAVVVEVTDVDRALPCRRVDQSQLLAADRVGCVPDGRILRDAPAKSLQALQICCDLAHQRDPRHGTLRVEDLVGGELSRDLGNHRDQGSTTGRDGQKPADRRPRAADRSHRRQVDMRLRTAHRQDVANGSSYWPADFLAVVVDNLVQKKTLSGQQLLWVPLNSRGLSKRLSERQTGSRLVKTVSAALIPPT